MHSYTENALVTWYFIFLGENTPIFRLSIHIFDPQKPGGWGNKFHFFPWNMHIYQQCKLSRQSVCSISLLQHTLSISFDVKYRSFKQYAFKRTVRNYRDVDFQIINNVIWKSSVFNSTNIHEIYDNFFSHHNKILDTHIPRKVIAVRHRDKLFTS